MATLPDTGASSIAPPPSAARSDSRRLASGAIVLMSAHTAPRRSPARMPSWPEATSSTAAVSVTIDSTTSASAATAAGVSARRMPIATSGSALAGERFQPVTVKPASSRRSTTALPIEPSPTKPTEVAFVPCSIVPPQRFSASQRATSGRALYQTLLQTCTPSSNTTVVVGPAASRSTWWACSGGEAGSSAP